MIVAARDEEAELLEKCLASVVDHVDHIYITITGENDKVTKVAEAYSAHITNIKWTNDFSAARNANLQQVKDDWYLWLDADDTLKGGEELRKLVEFADIAKIDGYGFLYKYNFDQYGNCVDQHWKIQFLRNDGHFKWQGKVHEDPIQQRSANWKKTHEVTRIHGSSDERGIESYARNIKILEASDKSDPRTLFYLGRSYLSVGDFERAVETLDEYLELSGWDEERYEAHLLIGQSYSRLGLMDEALRVYTAAILEREDYPDAYIMKGMTYLKQEEYSKALENFKCAGTKQLPDANTFFNPMLYQRDLLAARATCELHLGKFDDALKHATLAWGVSPKEQNVIELRKIIIGCRARLRLAEEYANIARSLREVGEEDKVLPLLASVPKALSDNPLLLALKFEYQKPVQWPKKSIVFYCGISAETWLPGDEDGKGIGGSETAIIQLAKRMVKLGWNVVVYNNCEAPPEGIVVDDVTYRNYWQFNIKDTFDVIVSWRQPALYDYEINARLRCLDLHDVMNPMDFTKERLEQIDKIFVKSKYHRSLFPQIADEKFVVVGNGIELERFVRDMERDAHRFVYTSSPNRGLDILLEYMWPKIKEKLPDAELHVYYGWDTFYKLEKHNPERMAWMKKVQALMNQPGVINHGRVGQGELAKELCESSFWLYPTYFPEIHCITALEMQAAGVIPLTSGYAALEETQAMGMKMKGDVFDPKWQEEYVNQVLIYSAIPDDILKDHRNVGYGFASENSWDKVSEKWNATLA